MEALTIARESRHGRSNSSRGSVDVKAEVLSASMSAAATSSAPRLASTPKRSNSGKEDMAPAPGVTVSLAVAPTDGPSMPARSRSCKAAERGKRGPVNLLKGEREVAEGRHRDRDGAEERGNIERERTRPVGEEVDQPVEAERTVGTHNVVEEVVYHFELLPFGQVDQAAREGRLRWLGRKGPLRVLSEICDQRGKLVVHIAPQLRRRGAGEARGWRETT
eukprot:scaffold246504_cov30-Tisochrysis_lutea.AAC.3